MAKGEGKGWAKGKSAANDPRVARAAAAHVGLTYLSHLADGEGKYHRSARGLALEWSDAMAYIVGLTATDGCLITGRRKINFKSADRDLVATYLGVLGRTNHIKTKPTKRGGVVHYTEFGDAALYRWFQAIGLTPRKSLTLGRIEVPDQFLAPLLRGLFEGDGHIQNFVHRPTVRKQPNYTYERLLIGFNSASRAHLDWLRERVGHSYGVWTSVQKFPPKPQRHDFFRLIYGKHDSIKLLKLMYPQADVPKLKRKWDIWDRYRRRHAV